MTPESAGWGYSSLRIVALAAGGTYQLDTGADEVIVLPLSGRSRSRPRGRALCSLVGRENVFAGPTDVAYLALGSK